MGGFLIPFLTQYDWINFRVPGVTSISVDTHKYGYSFKGSSVLLFKDYCYKQYQHFIQKDWNGGIYATPTMMGSKSGGLIAATWGSLLYTGKTNYKKFAVTIQKNVRYIVNVFRTHQILKEHVKIIGNPQINIIAFTDMMGYGDGAESGNGNGNDGDVCGPVGIYNVLDYMKKRGWNLSVMQNPNAFHLCITNLHDRDVCQLFCETMVEAVEYCLQDTEKKLSGTLALYGSSTQIQNSLFLEDIIHNYIFLLSKNTILEKYF
jgi:sphinganine-1-phosphate aldolase